MLHRWLQNCIISKTRQHRRWSCTCANKLDFINSTKYTFHAMEYANFSIKNKGENLHVISISRPPDTTILSLADDIANLMKMNVNSLDHLIIMTDMCINMNNSADNDTIAMNALLDSFNPMNNVIVPTHKTPEHPRCCAD